MTFSGLLACVLFSLCSCVTGLAAHNHRRWQVIITLFVIGVIAFLIALYLQPVPLGHKLFLGYYAMALSFMLVVTVFDTTRLFEKPHANHGVTEKLVVSPTRRAGRLHQSSLLEPRAAQTSKSPPTDLAP